MTHLNPALLLSPSYQPGLLHPFIYSVKISEIHIWLGNLIQRYWFSHFHQQMHRPLFSFFFFGTEVLMCWRFTLKSTLTHSWFSVRSLPTSYIFHKSFFSLCTFECSTYFKAEISVEHFPEQFFVFFFVSLISESGFPRSVTSQSNNSIVSILLAQTVLYIWNVRVSCEYCHVTILNHSLNHFSMIKAVVS